VADAVVQTLLNEAVHEVIAAHAKGSPGREVFGLIAGLFAVDATGQRFVLGEVAIPAHGTRGEAARVAVDHDAWLELIAQRDALCPGLRIVGWYHSHPGWGIFFSQTDRQTHRFVFFAAHHVGLVFEPIQDAAGVFSWSQPPGKEEAGTLQGPHGFGVYRPTARFYERCPEARCTSRSTAATQSTGSGVVCNEERPEESSVMEDTAGRRWRYRAPWPRAVDREAWRDDPGRSAEAEA